MCLIGAIIRVWRLAAFFSLEIRVPTKVPLHSPGGMNIFMNVFYYNRNNEADDGTSIYWTTQTYPEVGVAHPNPFNFRSFLDRLLSNHNRTQNVTSHDRETFERHFAMSERDFGRMSESFCDHERLVIA